MSKIKVLSREEIEKEVRESNPEASAEDINSAVEGKGKDKIVPESIHRVAINFSKILEVSASSKNNVYNKLKDSKLGDFIDRDNLTFLGG